MKKIIILGTGGNCIDILDTINDINERQDAILYKCVGFLDDNPDNANAEFQGVKVLGELKTATEFEDCFFVNGLGSPKNFWKKEKIISKTNILPNRFETIVHPSASVSHMSKLGFGTVVFQNVTIASNAVIGNHVIVLPGSVISHHSQVRDYSCVASCAAISGKVLIKESSYVGAGSTIIENKIVGKYSLVGAGSVVIKNVDDNSVVVGNPARFLRNTF